MDALVVTTPQEYFRDLLSEALNRQQVAVNPDTEFYLVNLLSQFLSSDRLFTHHEGDSRDTEPLALMLAKAMDSPRETQIRTLRELGDVSLYMSGFFTDSLSRLPVDLNYYVQMGGSAYGKIAELCRGANLATLYAELSEKFRAFVEVLSEIAEVTAVASNAGVVRLYERWVQTGSVRLAKRLGEQGVMPSFAPAKGNLKQ